MLMKRKNSSAMVVGELQENYSSEVVPVAVGVELLPSQNTSHHKVLEAISVLLACRVIHWVGLSIPHHRDQEL